MLAFCGSPLPLLGNSTTNTLRIQSKRPFHPCPTVQRQYVRRTVMSDSNKDNEDSAGSKDKRNDPLKLLGYAAAAVILSSVSLSPLHPEAVHASPMNSAPLRFKQSLLTEDEGGPVTKLRAQWDVKSIDCKTETFLMFSNDSSSVVDLWWIDYFGHEVYYASINPGTTHIQPSFVSHPWVIRDHISQNSLLVLVAEAQPALAVVNNI